MRKLGAGVLLILVVSLVPVRAQDNPIRLSDDTPTTVKGHVNPLSGKDYRLNVRANQPITIHLTSTSAKKLVKFNLRRDKYTGKPLAGADAVTDWEGTLKDSGDYWIGVFALPAAGEENFTLVISPASAKKSDESVTSTESAPLDPTRIPKTGSTPQSFVPRGWKIGARAEGDLNGDGRVDQVLQLVPADTPDDGAATDSAPEAHALLIVLSEAGTLRRSAIATKLLVPVAPQYSLDLGIKAGVLSVKQSYGMSDVIDMTHLFRLDPSTGKFLLIGRDVFTYSRPLRSDTIKTSENYLTGVRLTTTGHFRRGAVGSETTKREQIERKKVYLEDVDTDGGG
jgi:hypothetical protein